MKSNTIYNWPETNHTSHTRPSLKNQELDVEYRPHNMVGQPCHRINTHFFRLVCLLQEEEARIAPPMGKGSVPFIDDDDTFFE